ncbi:repetitive organellar protein [Halyomorpha halys]|uniref:repetitive organellar protein n=1 Tax=Halyomorpha halys TaxID=286706 RepID=UPI0006D4D3EC|nr:uncharacterized protein LOC106686442 [Halyomorpha halys]
MTTDSRRELINIVEKENALMKINNFLFVKVVKKKHESKTKLPNKINDVNILTVNELLIKKILEYRQVRNYNREEENYLKANVDIIRNKVMEFRKKTYNIMDNIIKKQDKLIHCYENLDCDFQDSDIMKMKQLVNEHSRLLVQFCCIIDEKQKSSIKLFWRSENKRERADNEKTNTCYITFDNHQHQNKLLREKLAYRKDKIQHEKNKLDDIIMALEKTRIERKEVADHIAEIVIPLIEENKEKCLQASSTINTNLRIRRKLLSEKAVLLRKVGILKYKNLAPHSKIINAEFYQ